MASSRVLIVEDDYLIALDVEDALLGAGYEICGIAESESQALAMAAATHPDFAVVDISLSPGDGRIVARKLTRQFAIDVLFASGQCDDVKDLEGSGALACLPKPYDPTDVPLALKAISDLSCGRPTGPLPDHMITLHPA